MATVDIGPGQIVIGGRRGFKNVAEQSHCMAAEISDRVREIAEARGLPESEVFERALERGLEDLWRTSFSRNTLTANSTAWKQSSTSVGRKSSERSESVRSSRATSTGA